MTTFQSSQARGSESVKLRCALGVRFRDTATHEIVDSGLRVTAAPVVPLRRRSLAKRVFAQVNPSGVWLWQGLPGLRGFELGVDDLPEAESPKASPIFHVEVEDEQRRFLPCSLQVVASAHGPFEFNALSGSWPWKDVPLFSAPERRVPAGFGVIRMSLSARVENRPARWALVRAATTVRSRNIEALGVANESGEIALMFPWPELISLPILRSPPGGIRLDAQGWEFSFECWHDFGETDANFADLNEILARPASVADTLWTMTSPPAELTRGTLRYGHELLVPEDAASSPEIAPASRSLIITPAGSPP